MLSGRDLNDTPFVAVDLETTGHRPGQDSILEIGAARIEDGCIVDTFSSLLRPKRPIPDAIRSLTGITDKMVTHSPGTSEVLPEFLRFAEGALFIAHDHRFDLGFLDFEIEVASGPPIPRPIFDTLALARRLSPGLAKYNLRFLAHNYDVDTRPDHRATNDALATGQIFVQMLPDLERIGLRTAGDVARFCEMEDQQCLAEKLTLTTDLPNRPGVYMFSDDEGTVFHVGRARDLRQKVRSYFYANRKSRRGCLAARAQTIDYLPSDSHLEAALLESRVLAHSPGPHVSRNTPRLQEPAFLSVDLKEAFPALRRTTTDGDGAITVGPYLGTHRVQIVAENLREVFDLRRCERPWDEAQRDGPCEMSLAGCPAPCSSVRDAEEYREHIMAALDDARGTTSRLRQVLVSRLRRSLTADRANHGRIRQGLKAYDRAINSMLCLRNAIDETPVILLDRVERDVAIHIIVSGTLVSTLLLDPVSITDGIAGVALSKSLSASLDRPAYVDSADQLDARSAADIYLVDRFRKEARPFEIRVYGDRAMLVSKILSVAQAITHEHGRRV